MVSDTFRRAFTSRREGTTWDQVQGCWSETDDTYRDRISRERAGEDVPLPKLTNRSALTTALGVLAAVAVPMEAPSANGILTVEEDLDQLEDMAKLKLFENPEDPEAKEQLRTIQRVRQALA